MASRFAELAIDCKNPVVLARFWCEAMDYVVLDEEVGLVSIGPDLSGNQPENPSELLPVWTFAQVPEEKSLKNRLHVDLRPVECSQITEVDRLLALGANYAEVGTDETSWVVLVDPEGNEFCVLSDQK